MNRYAVKKILKESAEITLPQCSYGKSRCWECIYFETESPDSKGQCRCSYRGRWYYPSEGCGNGITRKDYARQQMSGNHPAPRYSGGGGGGHYRAGGHNGGKAVGFTLVAIVVWAALLVAVLFSLGLIKSDVTFRICNNALTPAQMAEYSLDVVRMGDGSYSEDFKRYTAFHKNFAESGRSSMELAKGDYDIWIAHDGVSGYAVNVFIRSVFGMETAVNLYNLEAGAVKVGRLHLKGWGARQDIEESLQVKTSGGSTIPCTASGRNEYIVMIPDSMTPQDVLRLTVSAEGCKDAQVELDFSENRVADAIVRLSEK